MSDMKSDRRLKGLPATPSGPAPQPPAPTLEYSLPRAFANSSSDVESSPYRSDVESSPYRSSSARRAARASATFWASPNRFGRCLSLQVVSARDLPATKELALELKAGTRWHSIPLIMSMEDMKAGGSGRIDGGRLSERCDFTLDGHLDEVEMHLQMQLIVPWWHLKRSQHFVTRCHLREERWADPSMAGSSAPQWFPLLPLEEDEAAAPEDSRMPRRKTDEEDRRGPALLLRVQSFDAERLEIAESRERLFHHYSANGDYLLPDECDRMLADVASGWRPRPDADAIESTHGMRGWRLCVAHVLAAVGCYKPDMPLLHHLMYFHTLFWVCCRAPDEKHIPVVHRLYFVVLSVSFNLLVLVLFMATDASLVTVHCQPLQACSSLEVMLWRAAEVAVVALVDTAFWPLLKRLFLCIEAKLHHPDESEAEHHRALWQVGDAD